jgi:phage gpG-like protein
MGKGMEVSIIFDATDVTKYIRRHVAKCKDLTPAMSLCAARMKQSKRDMFDSEGHGKWPELSPMTKSIRAHAGKHGKPSGRGKMLKIEGRLFKSLQAFPLRRALIYGSVDPRAQVLFRGGTAPAPKNWKTRKRVRVPARNAVKFMKSDLVAFTLYIYKYLRSAK